MAIALGYCRIDPSAGGITAVEHIRDIQSDDGLFDNLAGFQRVAQVQVRRTIAGQRTVSVLRIVKVLTADIVGVPYSLQAFIVEIDETIQNGRRREGQCRVVVMELSQFVAVTVDMIVLDLTFQYLPDLISTKNLI